MNSVASQERKQEGTAEKPFGVAAPSLSLPKGGGAIKGIGEKFAANPVTGTGSMTIPVATSPGRAGFGPQLSLSYDSGAGNGPFGLGWNLPLPAITRKTDKGLPKYQDAAASDVFLLSGAEDLVPVLVSAGGSWVREQLPVYQVSGASFRIECYRPRIEGLFARIERWSNLTDSSDVRWRSLSRENITTWYGATANSRIADPSTPAHIFSWLICQTHDDKGNLIVYDYKAEDSVGVAPARVNERNRTPQSRAAQRYLKRIRYGNRTPYFPNFPSSSPATPLPADPDWMFAVVLDYGEHDADAPRPGDLPAAGNSVPWPVRNDPFSTYRAGFEVRTYRLCQRVLMFHHFPGEPGVGADCLVRSTDFTYSHEANPADARNSVFSFVTSVAHSGYQRQPAGGYFKKSLPPVEFTYTEAKIQSDVREVDPASLENLPAGLDGNTYQWVDLDGEGLSGILTEQGGGWFYKRNVSPTNLVGPNGSAHIEARFAPLERVATQPVSGLAAGRAQFMDLAGNGRPDLVTFRGPTPGFYERTADAADWEPLTPFTSLPVLDWDDPNLKFVDLTGDGHADLLIAEDNVFRWHPSLAEKGFGPEETARAFRDEEAGPQLLFGDSTQSIYLADMSGDGLTDLVRIRNGAICYWPNLGYGRFGAKVTMDHSPWLDHADQFDPRRIRLADIDGSGATDLIYLHGDGVHLYFNQSGNSWSRPPTRPAFPRIDSLSSVTVVDLLGNGTACLVWSSPLPGDSQRAMRYIDLMGGQKPHLLIKTRNNLGAETTVQYAPSTKFYLADKFAGKPWITKLPFPVHCVEKTTVTDKWRKTTFSSTYSYHHGYFDGLEREFRGFGRVEQIDTEDYRTFATENLASANVTQDHTLYQPPVKTITWFHTGAALDRQRILTQFATEYFPARFLQPGGSPEKALPEPELDRDLSTEEWREALRACKGMLLRQETYELDADALHGAVPAEIPVRLFSAATHNCHIRRLQPQEDNRHAVFLVTESEALSYQYELDLRITPLQPDPRIAHTLNLSFDELGNVQQSVAVGYPRLREFDDPELAAHAVLIREVQRERHVAYTETHYTGDAVDPALGTAPVQYYRLRAPCEVQAYELTGFTPAQGFYFSPSEFRAYELSSRYLPTTPSKTVTRKRYHQLPQDTSATMRLVEHARTLFFDDDATGPNAATRFLKEARPLGELGKLGLPYEQYKLALTEELLDAIFTAGQLTLNTPAGGSVQNALNNWKISGYLSDADATAKFGRPAAGEYWMRSGIAGFAPDAAQHFYLPENFTDAFNNTTTLEYDPLDLFIQSTRDALGNTSGILVDPATGKARFNYRVLAPLEMVDANGNHSEVRFDILGLVVAAAAKGKKINGRWEGDHLGNFTAAIANPPAADVVAFCTRDTLDEQQARDWLASASARYVYHFGDENGLWTQRMAGACAIARERNVGQLSTGEQSPLQVSLECSDGTGNILMKKVQAEPDPESTANNPPLRWIINGLTVLNNKGKPVKQYEPAFSADFGCELPQANGVTPVMYYDAAGRLVRTELPDGTFCRVDLSPWHALTFDANDTINEPGNAWYTQHTAANASLEEKRAAKLALVHQNTPALTILDSLGREVISITHNRIEDANGPRLIAGKHYRDEHYLSFTKLDAEGKPLWIRDARGNLVMQYLWPTKSDRDEPRVLRDFSPQGNPNNDIGARVPCYDIAGNLLFQHSMDAGNRWILMDAAGKPMFAWDFNERQTASTAFIGEQRLYCTDYDAMHRPTAQWLSTGGGSPQMVERFEYRDTKNANGSPNPQLAADQASNLIGQPVQHYDPSGLMETVRRDFKGNVLEAERRLNNQPKESLIDWQNTPLTKLETETFRQITAYDALNRMTLHYNWHRNPANVAAYEPKYNQRGLLQSEQLLVRANRTPAGPVGGVNATQPKAIQEIRYNVKGQKEFLKLGNGTLTQYDYDAVTFRLKQIRTTRRPADATDFPGRRSNLGDVNIVQQLLYTYDPVGNIAEVEDQAYKPVFFNQGIAEPKTQYEYDALYRLIWASGRESAQGGAAATNGDEPDLGHGFPITDQTLRRYIERYEYDSVGNFLVMEHSVPTDSASGWTRQYTPATDSNRLLRTWTGTNDWDHTPTHKRTEYLHDTHGSMRNLARTAAEYHLRWDHRDMIGNIALSTTDTAYYQYDSTKQRTRKRIERAGGMEERIYLGGFELYRRTVAGTVVEEIESHHLFEGKQRVLLVDDVVKTDRKHPNGTAFKTEPVFRFQYSNHLGSAGLELDDQAEIISYEEYHPYGTSAHRATKSGIEAAPKRYRYTGMERDEESGLSYHHARYCALHLTRWVSCDPLGVRSGLNFYRYGKSNPVSYSDPTGLKDQDNKSAPETDPKSEKAAATRDQNLAEGRSLFWSGVGDAAKAAAGRFFTLENILKVANNIITLGSAPKSVEEVLAQAAHERKLHEELGFWSATGELLQEQLNPAYAFLKSGYLTNEEVGQGLYLQKVGDQEGAAKHFKLGGESYFDYVGNSTKLVLTAVAIQKTGREAIRPEALSAGARNINVAPGQAEIVGDSFRYAGRDVIIVNTAEGRVAFYRSSGANSGMRGTWLPFEGEAGQRMLKFGENFPEGHRLHRYGTEEMRNVSNRLGEMDIPRGAIEVEWGAHLNRTLADLGARLNEQVIRALNE